MGDSDDEHDRRRRDKFRGERNEYRAGDSRREPDRRREEFEGRRDSWSRGRTRGDYREYRRERFSPGRGPDMSPPIKRMRPEGGWEDRGYRYDSGYNNYGNYSSSGPGGYQESYANRDPDMPTQPPMMSFKAFLAQQDDSITDEEAISKYNKYKLDFRCQQLNEFFVAHKEEEWFKIKYHPEESIKRKDEQLASIKRRVEVFMNLFEQQLFGGMSIDADQSEPLVRILDSVVILLEGGTEFDLTVLDDEPATEKSSEEVQASSGYVPGKDDKKKYGVAPPPTEPKSDPSQPLKMTISSEQVELQKKAKEFLKNKGSDGPSAKKRRHSSFSYDSGSESDQEEGNLSDTPDEPVPPGMESGAVPPALDTEKVESDEEEDEEEKPKENGKDDEVKSEKEDDDKEAKPTSEEPEETGAPHNDDHEQISDAEDDKPSDEKKETEESEDKTSEDPKPRPLHKTSSIFLRNLAPTITKQEVEAMCRRYSGFMRVAIADPQPERRWFRRGWVTFDRGVNIKEICWNLNNIRLRDCELGAIVNRDLSRRIRTVSGLTSHKQVVRLDIKLAAKIIQNLDSRHDLWASQEPAPQEEEVSFGFTSRNPVLKNITDYLIEEASAEEEELLGHTGDTEEGEEKEGNSGIERDDELIQVLDRLLFYLRIVHSVDYYNHIEYPNEDEMPNRCGLMHARGIPPSSKVTQMEIQEYCKQFEQKVQPFLQSNSNLSDEECQKLGMKDPDAEVEKFIQANTQELAKDKWLCPLSGKKFKGPEFVRKHIFNKQADKIDEVKKEVEYFNSYLRDPKRPMLPEHPGSKAPPRREAPPPQERPPDFPPAYNYGGYRPPPGYYNPPGYPRDPYMREAYPPREPPGYMRGRGGYRMRMDSRQLIQYRDLDAPRDIDELF